MLDWSEQKDIIKNCNSSVHKILSQKTSRCYAKRGRTSCPFWAAVLCAPQLRWMPCCLESFWLYNYVNWWTSHENWFKSFEALTVEAFNAVDSAKSFNLGAPVKNQLNWIDKIKLFFSSHFKVWQDQQTSAHSERRNANLTCCDRPEEAPERDPRLVSINRVCVGRVPELRVLTTLVTKDLSWTTNTSAAVKRTHHWQSSGKRTCCRRISEWSVCQEKKISKLTNSFFTGCFGVCSLPCVSNTPGPLNL